MFIKHLKTVLPGNDTLSRVSAVTWSPNNQKVAVATSDKVITLYDETGERKDRFATKPADPANPKVPIIVYIQIN